MLCHETLDRIFAEAPTTDTGEDRRVGFRRPLAQPGLEEPRDVAAQRRTAQLPPLPVAADVGTAAEGHVLSAERNELGDAQVRLDGAEEDLAHEGRVEIGERERGRGTTKTRRRER